jgi:hypothetical protein
MASLAIRALTHTFYVLHQSTWLSAQPLTPVRWVGCMCVVLRDVPNGDWVGPSYHARAVTGWGTISSNDWTKGRKPGTSWGWLLSNHILIDPAQHFFLVESIASWASHAFPKMQSLMNVLTQLLYNNNCPHAKWSKRNLPNCVSTMDVLIVFRALSRDLRNPFFILLYFIKVFNMKSWSIVQ